ncbi:MAG: tetratricopeptide repeat protein [Verrucomicrobiota bacterium]|nr:tetratricopeptide repeat protein [Verrucomicrobiota bacterium]
MFRRIFKHWLGILLLLLGVGLAYSRVLLGDFEFVWDDRYNFVENTNFNGLSAESVKWMFTTHHMGHYIPLSWLSLAIDQYLWGMNPKGFHVTNLLLHWLNSMLLYWLALRVIERIAGAWAQGRKLLFAIAVALIFAVHPTHVESVAWITERRDLLSFFFIMLMLLAWSTYVEGRTRRRWLYYTLALGVYLLALLSKSMVMTFPAVLILLDYLYFQRARFIWLKQGTTLRSQGCLLLEKIPFIVLAVGVAYRAVEAANATVNLPLLNRIIQSGYGLVFYIEKTLLPQSLSPLYLLRSDFDPMQWPSFHLAYALLSAVCAVVLVYVVVSGRERWRLIAAGLCFYVITVSPVLGLVEAGIQIAADRYTYIPCIGLLFVLVYGIIHWCGQRLALSIGILGLAVSGLLIGTLRQTGIWRNEVVFWQHALDVDPQNYAAATNLGLALDAKGDTEQAFRYYEVALQTNPRFSNALFGRGSYYKAKGDRPQALRDFSAGLLSAPGNHKARFMRAKLLMELNQLDAALADIQIVIEAEPETTDYFIFRGMVHYRKGNQATALDDFNHAIALNPDSSEAFNNRGILHRTLGQMDASLNDFDRAIQLDAKAADSYYNRALTQRRLGKYQEALDDYDSAIRLDHNFTQAYNNRALLYQVQNRSELALADFSRALQISPKDSRLYQNRGNLYRELRQYVLALSDYESALRLNPAGVSAKGWRAVCLWRLGQLREAGASFAEAIQAEPADTKLELEYVRFLHEQQRSGEALTLLHRILGRQSIPDEQRTEAQELLNFLTRPPTQ